MICSSLVTNSEFLVTFLIRKSPAMTGLFLCGSVGQVIFFRVGA